MLNLLLLAVATAVILGVARYNKSNRLFWLLMMSLLMGFACGAIGERLKKTDTKKDGTTYVAPMHASTVLTIIDSYEADAALPTDTRVSFDTEYASLGYIYRDMVPAICTTLTFNPDMDTGSIVPFVDTG